MGKRIIIQVAGNPKYTPQPKPNTPILNHKTGTPLFGHFPEIIRPEITFPAGPIYLRYGQHFGPNRGHGFEHIWREHFKQYQTSAEAIPVVTGFLDGVLQSGSSIHYEGGLGSAGNRNVVWRRLNGGLVVLESRLDGQNNPYYAIVTAFPGKGAHGTQIGHI